MFSHLQEKDNYNNEVTQLARPLPVEYLLVTLPAAFASDFHYTFKSNIQMDTFPVENRENAGQVQVCMFHFGTSNSAKAPEVVIFQLRSFIFIKCETLLNTDLVVILVHIFINSTYYNTFNNEH